MADWETYINSFPTATTLSSQNLSDGPHSTLHGNLGAAINAWLIDAQAAMGSYTTFARKLAAITSANVVNPTSATYGAVGDGSTDDTTAIQSALTALALIGGGVLVLPEGQFNVTGITVPSNVFIVGAGVGSTTIHCTAALGTTVNFEGTYSALSSSSHCKNAGLRGVKITGTSTGVGINLEHASSLHLTDFRVDNVAYGIRAYGAWDSIIDGDWRVQECDYGLFYASHQNDAILSGVVDTNNIRHVGGTIESCYVTDITITGKGTDGTGTGAQKPNHITFDALKVESSFVENAPRIVLESVHAVRLQTPLFAWTNYNSGFSTPVHGVSIDGDSMQVTFASPSCTNNTTNVIDAWFYLNGTDFCTITDPMFLLNAAPSTAHIEFAGTNDRVEYPVDGLKLGPTFTPANLTIVGTPTSVRRTFVRADGQVAMTAALTLSDGYAAASTNYVDNAATGLSWKTAVACATTANITLSGEQTIDGVATSASRVLVKNQSTASQNGVYVSAAGAWSRATDMDAGSEFPGAAVLVSAGTTLANTAWTCTNTVAPTVGTTAITFAQFSGGATTLAGDVTGASSSNTVTRIRNRTVHTTTPFHGEVYAWDDVNSRFDLYHPLDAVVCKPATGTPATDEANFIAACDEAMSSGTKRVWLRGTGTDYVFDSTVTLSSTYNGLSVEGPRSATIKASAVTVNPLRISGNDITLRGFTLDGADTITAGTGDRAASAANLLILQECDRVTVEDMRLEYAGNNAITMNSASQCVIRNNLIWQSGGTAISSQANLRSVSGNVVEGNVIDRTERTGDDGYQGGGIKMMGHQVGQGGQATYGACATSDVITTYASSARSSAVAHGRSNGDFVYVAVETGSAGIVSGRRYYITQSTSTTFKLATTKTLALAGTSDVDITSTGNVKLGWFEQRRMRIEGNEIREPFIFGGLTLTGVSATNGSSTFTKTAHGLPAGRTECRVYNFSGFTGLTATTTIYYVESTGTNTFQIFTASSGGSAQSATATGTFTLTTVPAEAQGGNEGIVVQEPSAIGPVVANNTVLGGTIGISMSTCESPAVTGNHVQGFSKFGFEFAGVQDFTCAGNTADGDQLMVSDALGTGLVPGSAHLGIVAWPEDSVRSSYRGTIVGNSVRGLRPTTQANFISKGIVVQDPSGRDMQVTVADNVIAVAGVSGTVGSYGIHVNRAWGVNVTGNQIDGNELGGTASEGIRIQGSGSDAFLGVFIRGNQFRSLNRAIYFNTSGSPSLDDAEIAGNMFHSSVTTVLVDDSGWSYGTRTAFRTNFGSATAATDEVPMVNT